MEKPRLVPLGKIVRTHGVRGGLKIYPYGETLAELQPGEKLFLHPESRMRADELTIAVVKPQGKLWMVHFSELSDMDAAKELVGEEIFIPEDRLPPVSEGEYYHYQLIGLEVETVDGRKVGFLRGIIETAANDVYVIGREEKEVLVPAVEDVICEIDLERGRVVIDPPEGLIDDL